MKRKNTKKNHQNRKISPSTRKPFRGLPIIAAMAASGFIQPAYAVDRTWFGGTGDFGVATNWTPNGAPGNGDRAIISAGTATLSFNAGIAGLDISGGGLRGEGRFPSSPVGGAHDSAVRGSSSAVTRSVAALTVMMSTP